MTPTEQEKPGYRSANEDGLMVDEWYFDDPKEAAADMYCLGMLGTKVEPIGSGTEGSTIEFDSGHELILLEGFSGDEPHHWHLVGDEV